MLPDGWACPAIELLCTKLEDPDYVTVALQDASTTLGDASDLFDVVMARKLSTGTRLGPTATIFINISFKSEIWKARQGKLSLLTPTYKKAMSHLRFADSVSSVENKNNRMKLSLAQPVLTKPECMAWKHQICICRLTIYCYDIKHVWTVVLRGWIRTAWSSKEDVTIQFQIPSLSAPNANLSRIEEVHEMLQWTIVHTYSVSNASHVCPYTVKTLISCSSFFAPKR